MSNHQWDSGQGERPGEEQPPTQDPGPEGSHATGQPAADQWSHSHGPGQGPGSQPHPQQQTSGAWNPPPGWTPGAPGQQAGPGEQQYGGFAPGPGQQWSPQPPRAPSAFSNIFDFSFRRFALPEAGGTIFLVAVILILLRWLVDLVWTLSWGADFADITRVLLGDLAVALLYILLVRAFLEGMSALVMRSRKDRAPGGR
ncbi:MAG: hypothetical protein Q4P15_00795 [Propionibacteriaceae bacterium]|nr:hypothetical protein [Propionibacteriaceae bacterium]